MSLEQEVTELMDEALKSPLVPPSGPPGSDPGQELFIDEAARAIVGLKTAIQKVAREVDHLKPS